MSIEKPWELSGEELYRAFNSSPSGLSEEEAHKRIAEFGLNELLEKDRRTTFSIFRSQFESPLIYILIFATAIAFFLSDTIEALVILAIVALNGGLGFFQEFKSERALQSLERYVSFSAVVTRNGVKKDVDSREVVPGDIITVHVGDKIPADFRIISFEEFETDESVLTGESFPVEKNNQTLTLKDPRPNEITNMGFMGTIVKSGHAIGIVTATGEKTFLGKTAVTLSAKVPQTNFELNIRKFGNMLIAVTILMTIFVFLVNAVLGRNLLTSFLFALALAVGITPEALPMVITIALSTGALELAKKKVIVKKLVSIEDLGNMDVLCADKTGTLSENKLILGNAVSLDGKYSEDLLEKAVLCNSLLGKRGKLRITNPFDEAIFELANEKIEKTQLDKLTATIPHQILDFDFERRRMSVVLREGGEFLLLTKGAADFVVPACSRKFKSGREVGMEKGDEKLHEAYASQGYSVLALAVKRFWTKKTFTPEDENNLTLLGFLLFTAPPKKTSIHTVSDLQKLGVELKILTGDGPIATKKLCSDIGFVMRENRIVLGSELEQLGKTELEECAEKYNVFARVTPEQKYAIVLALRRRGHTVGFMGDGVNDAPALRAADVGISVNNAVDVAKDAADMLLFNKSLEGVLTGVKIGRKVFGNITKYILNTISANFGNMFTVAISSLVLKFLPLLPSQILLNNLVSDVPLLTVSTDNVDSVFLRKPKKWNLSLISKFMVQFGFLSFIFDALTIALLIYWLQAPEDPFRTAWFLESVLSEIIITFAIRTQQPFYKSSPSRLLFVVSVLAAVLSIAVIYSPIAYLFSFVPLGINYLIIVAIAVSLYFALAETCKLIFFRRNMM